MPSPQKSSVVLLGLGGVGRAFLELLLRAQPGSAASEVGVLAVVDSVTVLKASADAADGHLSRAALSAVLLVKQQRTQATLASVAADPWLKCVAEPRSDAAVVAAAAARQRVVVADCSASDTEAVHTSVLGSTAASVVLANKKPLCGSWSSFQRLTAERRRLRAESTVGAGLPVHAAIRRCLSSGDAIHHISGVFSGTLGYVMSGLEQGSSFSSVVAAAKAAGFTEPDPRDDLSGLDVARKALILARLLGWPLELSQVDVQSLYPGDMAPDRMSVEQFMANLHTLDAQFSDQTAKAAADGSVLRYAAVIKDGACTVGLVPVPAASPLGRLKGTDNLCEVHSLCYDTAPLVIQGRGAGATATAAGVLADVIELLDCSCSTA